MTNAKKGLDFIINGKKLDARGFRKSDGHYDPFVRSIDDVTKESLAAKPLKFVLQSNQKYLSIGYDLVGGHLTLKQQGVEVEKLPPVPAAEAVICQNKMVDTSTADMRYV